MSNITKKERLSRVDIFRALAIFLVLFFHTNQIFYNSFNYDWFNISQWERTGGVDFFLIVSGFMIYYLYHGYIGKKGKAFDFIAKRAIRIYPLYAIFSLAAISIYFIVPHLPQFSEKEMDLEFIIKTLLLIPVEPPLIKSTWSLNYIVLFYFIFSLLVFKPKIFKPLIAIWTICMVLLFVDVGNSGSFSTNRLSYSMLEITTGSFIAYLVLNFKYTLKLNLAKTLFATGIIGYLLVYLNNYYVVYDITNKYFYGPFAALIMFGIVVLDLKKPKTLTNKTLKLLVSSSYAMYISHTLLANFHVLSFKFLNLHNIFGDFLSLFIIIGLTVISGCIVHLLLEKPITSFLNNFYYNHRHNQKFNELPNKAS